MALFSERPGTLLRAMFRLPVYLYRLDLGWLLGHRFLMVTHRGRKTGLLRQTVVEVLRYDPATQESIVISALGERADWFRNLRANPPLEVQTARARYVPLYRVPTPDETASVLGTFSRDHPLEMRVAEWMMGWENTRTEEGQRALSQSVRLVAFRPARGDENLRS